MFCITFNGLEFFIFETEYKIISNENSKNSTSPTYERQLDRGI